MLRAISVDDGGAAADDVADDAAAGPPGEFLDDVMRKSARIGRKRSREMHPGNFPVAGGAVFAGGPRFHHSPGSGWSIGAPDAFEWRDVAKSRAREIRQRQAANGA